MPDALVPHFDFRAFAARAQRARPRDPAAAARAGLSLVDGALRIRRGGDGIYGDVPKPITKPAEAVAAWLRDIESAIAGGEPFRRSAELQEAIVAAGEEVDAAARAMPAAERLRGALYRDAIDVLGASPAGTAALPWLIVAALGGILVGILISMKRRR